MTVGTTWSGHHRYAATTLHHPRTLAELCDIVARAPRIRALGTRHAFTDLADAPELVSLAGMPSDIRIDPETETVSVSAGVRYGELAVALQRAGFALRNLASLPHISIGGAIATGTHGSGDRNGTLSRAVTALDLVLADGQVRTITPVDPDFDGVVVGLGALGVVARLTLDIEPTFDVRQDVYEGLPWSALLEHLDAIMARAYSVSVFTRWTGEDVGQVWLKSVIGERKPPQSLYGAAPVLGPRHPIPDVAPEVAAATATAQAGAPGAWLDRLPHFRLDHTPSHGDELQSEYFIPRTHAVAALTAVRTLASRIEPLLYVSELRTIAADSLWLSGAYGEDVLGIHFTWHGDPEAVRAVVPAIEEALAPFAARPHWAKVFDGVDPAVYPRWDDFVDLAARLDPDGVFRNDFLARHGLVP